MANAVYTKAKEALLGANLDLSGATVKCVMVTSAYTYSAAHQYLSSVGAPSRVATSSGLANKTITDGTFDADDVVFTTPASGSTVIALILFVDTGVEGTSRLICYIDTGTGLPLTTNGGNINIVWNASGILVLS
jgi:hypothetical protein